MIPKIIHYCWYGKGKKDLLTERCIASWKKYCPDYKIIEWNEDNCDIESSVWAREAYESEKWAFVSDYFRLKVMYEYGGIYMDTDVEIVKNIDEFLANDAFVGLADDTYIGSGIFGCGKGNAFCKELLAYYEGRHFINIDGSVNDVPNNQIYTMICMKKLGFNLEDEQIECGNTKVYPSDFFSPFKIRTLGDPEIVYNYKNYDCTSNTHAIHYTVFSWRAEQNSFVSNVKIRINQVVRIILPRKVYFKIKRKSKQRMMEKSVFL